ncbi:MAG: SusC/RagA family TonB-linked outer membrane protein, partial [Mangrovibacterium sp.]
MKKNRKRVDRGNYYLMVRKFVRFMKLTALLSILVISQALAIDSYSQETRLSLRMNNSPVKEVLLEIEKNSEFFFLYSNELIDVERKVDINITNKKINEILNKIFRDTGVQYYIKNRQIILSSSPAENFVSKSMFQQPAIIKGIVTDEKGAPLPGVSIVKKGTAQGTISDNDGTFLLREITKGDVLVFTFIGMKSIEVTYSGQANMNIKLEKDIIGLEEVVAIGYGVQKKRDLTGAISSVKSDDIIKMPSNNAIDAIQGMIPGMTISRTSGAAGAGVDILIRGNRSINGSNEPLFIIDGIQGANFEDINASDIESINVLKDASSTAIYGSQGANGVIIITTKQGKAGKTKVSYNGYYGIYGITRYPDSRTGDDYIQLRREASRTAGLWNSAADVESIFSDWEWEYIQNNKWVDWQDLLLHDGTLQNHVVNISGGNEKTQSLLSVGYLSEEGMYKNDKMDKYTVRVNVNY